eukprot:364476-Chlamydomonas_euryale.AAC.4
MQAAGRGGGFWAPRAARRGSARRPCQAARKTRCGAATRHAHVGGCMGQRHGVPAACMSLPAVMRVGAVRTGRMACMLRHGVRRQAAAPWAARRAVIGHAAGVRALQPNIRVSHC